MTTDSRYTDLRVAIVLVTADADSIQEKKRKSMHLKLTVTQIKEKYDEDVVLESYNLLELKKTTNNQSTTEMNAEREANE